jgi:hypothetical protein
MRTVKRMLTPGEPVRNASVTAVFSDLGVDFDDDAYLGIASHPAPQQIRDEAPRTTRPTARKLLIPGVVIAIVVLCAFLIAVKNIHRSEGIWSIGPSRKADPKPDRWMVLYDDFTRDSTLDPGQWTVNGPAISNSLVNFESARATIVSPQLSFDPQSGLGISGIDANNQHEGVQSVQSFAPPFTITAEGMTENAHAESMELAIVNDSGASGISLLGGQGNTDEDTGFVFASPSGPANAWSVAGRLSPIPPDDEVWYTLAIRVDASGNATVAASSDGHILGQATQHVGTGPFHVVLGQSSTGQQPAGPNQAYWLAFQVIHG